MPSGLFRTASPSIEEHHHVPIPAARGIAYAIEIKRLKYSLSAAKHAALVNACICQVIDSCIGRWRDNAHDVTACLSPKNDHRRLSPNLFLTQPVCHCKSLVTYRSEPRRLPTFMPRYISYGSEHIGLASHPSKFRAYRMPNIRKPFRTLRLT